MSGKCPPLQVLLAVREAIGMCGAVGLLPDGRAETALEAQTLLDASVRRCSLLKNRVRV